MKKDTNGFHSLSVLKTKNYYRYIKCQLDDNQLRKCWDTLKYNLSLSKFRLSKCDITQWNDAPANLQLFHINSN